MGLNHIEKKATFDGMVAVPFGFYEYPPDLDIRKLKPEGCCTDAICSAHEANTQAKGLIDIAPLVERFKDAVADCPGGIMPENFNPNGCGVGVECGNLLGGTAIRGLFSQSDS